jgi:hypothetical protein
MSMEFRFNNTDKGNPKISEKKLSSAILSTTDHSWNSRERKLGLSWESSVKNRHLKIDINLSNISNSDRASQQQTLRIHHRKFIAA